MSILPNKDLSSASSSSSQPPFQNPNHELSQYPPISPSYEFKSIKSLQISNSIDVPTNISVPVAPAEENSLKKVNESGKPNDKKFVVHQDNGKKSHSRRTSRSIDSQASSSLTAGRKTQMVNGNHLLNFYYDPISRPQPRAPPPRRHQKRKPYNKDLFLQANYKFVVLDCGNYAPEQLDPDKMLKWEDIICVKFSTPFSVQCPVCLDDPLCPQITSCGHIFCFPCILKYFLTGEDDHKGEYWKKCPLCFVMISSKDLYTIYIENVKLHCIGDAVEFMLLTRQKDSFILSLKNNQGIGINEEASDSFSKFTFTSDVDLSVRKAISDLDNWLARTDSGLVDDLEKLPYVCAAMEQLEKRRKYWNEQRVCQGNMSYKCPDSRVGPDAPSDHTNADPESCKLTGVLLSTSDNGKSTWARYPTTSRSNVEVCLDQIVDEMEPLDDQEGALSSSYEESKSMQRNFDVFKNVKDMDSYSFYQAVDGQHVVLHPLNMKCLLHHYGSYDMLPHRISGKILQLETVSQSEAMRRRYRFLSHFTLTTTFQLCEIDLSKLLPPNTRTAFMDEIKNREKQRKRQARKERDEKIRAEAALTHSVVIPFNSVQCSYDKPPTFSMDDFEALGSSSSSASGAAASSSSSSPPPPAVGERQLFSNVAKLGFAAGHDSPALQTDNSRSLLKHEVASDSSGLDGMRNASPSSFASIISREKSCEGVDAPKMNEMVKKGKKPSRVLLSTAGGRRY